MTTSQNYSPVVSAEESLPEMTLKAVILGIILSIFFAIGNAFIGLKAGMTVSASIPASVISMGILRTCFKRVSILENNIVQTMASAGEALASGVIFTIPTLYFLGESISIGRTFMLSILGGFLGIFFMLPMREHFVVKEHGKLLFPEGTACAEILKAGEKGAKKALLAIYGVLLGALFRFCTGFLHLWPEVLTLKIKSFRNSVVSLDTTPALLGVGFIIGPRIASTMLSGGLLGWWIIMPLMKIFASGQAIVPPATEAFSSLSNSDIWSNYIRYIGAGGVTVGGILSLFRIFPGIVRAFKLAFKKTAKDVGDESLKVLRTAKDLPYPFVIIGAIFCLLGLWLIPVFHLNFFSVLLIAVLGFFFVAVTSMTVGLVGSSSNPASGIIIMTLLISLFLFLAFGWTDRIYMITAAIVSSVVSVAICIASDTSQDLKTGFLVGATPQKQQIAMMIGTVAAACVIGFTLILLNKAYHLGSSQLSAPQATLLSMIVKGFIQGDLPYQLIIVGVLIGISVELMGIHALAFAIGLYLPLETTTCIFVGGLVSLLVHRKRAEGWSEKGVLFASGLVAGDALMGILVALFAILGLTQIGAPPILYPIFGLIAYLVMTAILTWVASPSKSEA
ncbi:MAG: hypothetical protein S4CHLAM7_09890 [Chlamydiae bacterium]|nr:hypothetical protein [Chlamydiota bacterium]